MVVDTFIISDLRPILAIIMVGGGEWSQHEVGKCDVGSIVPYEEAGQGAMVPWFAIYKGERIHSRVNAATVEEVIYKETPDAPDKS